MSAICFLMVMVNRPVDCGNARTAKVTAGPLVTLYYVLLLKSLCKASRKLPINGYEPAVIPGLSDRRAKIY